MLARAIRDDRSPVELERCLEIRREVFIEEQQIAKHLELDELDPDCTHFLAWSGPDRDAALAVGTARLWIDSAGVAKAQRVAVLAAARGIGLWRWLDGAGRGERGRRPVAGGVLTAVGGSARGCPPSSPAASPGPTVAAPVIYWVTPRGSMISAMISAPGLVSARWII